MQSIIKKMLSLFKDLNKPIKSNSIEQEKRRNESKYKDYNYSYQTYCTPRTKTIENKTIVENKHEIQAANYFDEIINDYYNEYGIKPDFDKQKDCVFAENETNFDFHNDYNGNACREYFLLNGKWAYFDYDDYCFKFKLIICENKNFYNDCYIEKMTTKTKKLLKFIKSHPGQIEIFNADLKSNVLKNGDLITCQNCYYDYYSENKKCPNCGINTKENLGARI